MVGDQLLRQGRHAKLFGVPSARQGQSFNGESTLERGASALVSRQELALKLSFPGAQNLTTLDLGPL